MAETLSTGNYYDGYEQQEAQEGAPAVVEILEFQEAETEVPMLAVRVGVETGEGAIEWHEAEVTKAAFVMMGSLGSRPNDPEPVSYVHDKSAAGYSHAESTIDRSRREIGPQEAAKFYAHGVLNRSFGKLDTNIKEQVVKQLIDAAVGEATKTSPMSASDWQA